MDDSQSLLLPVRRKRPGRKQDHADLRFSDLLRDEMRLGRSNDCHMDLRPKLLLDFYLQRQQSGDYVCAEGFNHDGYLALEAYGRRR